MNECFQYNENPSVSAFMQTQLNKLRERSVVFDIEAILIKPVQRILKYPLLLNELFKVSNPLVCIIKESKKRRNFVCHSYCHMPLLE